MVGGVAVVVARGARWVAEAVLVALLKAREEEPPVVVVRAAAAMAEGYLGWESAAVASGVWVVLEKVTQGEGEKAVKLGAAAGN